jgi:hypothetical protein
VSVKEKAECERNQGKKSDLVNEIIANDSREEGTAFVCFWIRKKRSGGPITGFLRQHAREVICQITGGAQHGGFVI